MISPKDLISKLGVKGLNDNADDHYKGIPIPNTMMAKPFSSIMEAPSLLYRLSLVLDGLHLGVGMKILDFGAGICWLSRVLNQLGCSTISLDVSSTALSIGEIMFRDYPIVGDYIEPPCFLCSDGIHIDLEDESIDRIVCFDAFHHCSDHAAILEEFYRVLKPGGIVGFSEPGSSHSRSEMAQLEMRNFGVLETDIHVRNIERLAQGAGFSRMKIKLIPIKGVDLSPLVYVASLNIAIVISKILRLPFSGGVTTFFLEKGKFQPDSRIPIGLSGQIVTIREYKVMAGQILRIPLEITNTGSSKWLCCAKGDKGAVKVGGHLRRCDGFIVNYELRSILVKDILPSETFNHEFEINIQEPGEYLLELDMVSECVTWFLKPIDVRINVS